MLIGVSVTHVGSFSATSYASLHYTTTNTIIKLFLTGSMGPACGTFDPHTVILISEDARHGITYSHAYVLKPKYFKHFCSTLQSLGCDEEGYHAAPAPAPAPASIPEDDLDVTLPTTVPTQPSSEAVAVGGDFERRVSRVSQHTEQHDARGIHAVYAGHELGAVLVDKRRGDDVIRAALQKVVTGHWC